MKLIWLGKHNLETKQFRDVNHCRTRKPYYTVTAFLCAFLCFAFWGCTGNQNGSGDVTPGTVTETGVITPDGQSTPTQPGPATDTPTPPMELKGTALRIAVPVFNSPSEEQRTEINRRLQKTDLGCYFEFTDMPAATDSEYRDWLLQQIEEGKAPDILNTGSWYTQAGAAEFVKEYFYPLDTFLISEDGGDLLRTFTKLEWERVQVGYTKNVVPRMFDPKSGSNGVYLRIDSAFLPDGIGAYNGTLDELLRIQKESARGKKIVIPYASWKLVFAFDTILSYDGIPYGFDSEGNVSAGAEYQWENVLETWKLLAEALRNGDIVDRSCQTVSEDEIFAEAFYYLPESKTGCDLLCLKKNTNDPLLNGCYGVYRESANAELAMKALAVCVTDPELAALLFPRMETAENVTAYHERMSEEGQSYYSNFSGFVPELSEEEKARLIDLKNAMYELEDSLYYDGIEGTVLAETIDTSAFLAFVNSGKYTDFYGELTVEMRRFFIDED